MRIESEFTVDAPPERAWAELLDTEDLVSCLPGASLKRLGREDVFQGPVELGGNGASVAVRGTLRPIDADEDERQASFRLLGHQAEGPASGKGILEGRVAAANGTTLVALVADLDVTGQTARPEVVEGEARRLLDGFADQLRSRVQSRADEPAPRAERAAPSAAGAGDTAAAAAAPAAGRLPSVEPADAMRKLAPALVALALIAALIAVLVGRKQRGFSVAFRYRG
jgi:carbon monoxide dehydrogenase subunit G